MDPIVPSPATPDDVLKRFADLRLRHPDFLNISELAAHSGGKAYDPVLRETWMEVKARGRAQLPCNGVAKVIADGQEIIGGFLRSGDSGPVNSSWYVHKDSAEAFGKLVAAARTKVRTLSRDAERYGGLVPLDPAAISTDLRDAWQTLEAACIKAELAPLPTLMGGELELIAQKSPRDFHASLRTAFKELYHATGDLNTASDLCGAVGGAQQRLHASLVQQSVVTPPPAGRGRR